MLPHVLEAVHPYPVEGYVQVLYSLEIQHVLEVYAKVGLDAIHLQRELFQVIAFKALEHVA